uniref:Putative serine protease n=2 Tax=Culex tarsalis TaxID=7177 RepID=A0A1Q3FQZ6_CULTA
MLLNLLLLLFCTVNRGFVNGELMPDYVGSVLSLNPLMPNDEQSVKDCPFTYYPFAKNSLTSSSSSEGYQDNTFAHVVKLDIATIEEGAADEACLGAIVDPGFVLTTKRCASQQPQTISFANTSLPRRGVQSTRYHLTADVALLQLKTRLSIDHQVTPACFWSDDASTVTGFPNLQRISTDALTGGLRVQRTKCPLAGRGRCYDDVKRNSTAGLLQVQAVSNYRLHPFVVALGRDNRNGEMVEVSAIADWIEQETGTKVDGIDCAVRYAKYRQYDDRVTTMRTDSFQLIELHNAHFSPTMANSYQVSIGFYVEDPTRESVVTYACYGTLLHRQYVLTVASCLEEFRNHSIIVRANQVTKLTPIKGTEFRVVEDTHYLEEAYVARVHLHPEFSRVPLKNDLALLQLDVNDFSFEKGFKPACLWPRDSFDMNEFQTNGHGPRISAEDRVDESLLADRRLTELYVISKPLTDECPLSLTANQLCVGDAVTIVPGTCELNRGSAMAREIWVLSHIIMEYVFAIGSKGENCGFNTPSTFTKIAPYISWIDSVMFKGQVTYNDSNVYYGDECSTTSGRGGVCLSLSECPGMEERVRNNKAEVQQASCGFEKDVSLVCCSTKDAVGVDTGEDLRDAMKEIENCPNLYEDLRANRLSQNLRRGSPTAAGVVVSNSTSHYCYATLISKRFLITSASCLERFPAVSAKLFRIGRKEVQQSPVVEVFPHPKYNALHDSANIAVLKLATPISINREVIPACLWQNETHVPFVLEIVGRNSTSAMVDISTYPLYRKACDAELVARLSHLELCVMYDASTRSSSKMICEDQGIGIYNYFAHGLHRLKVTFLVGVFNRGTGCELDGIGVFTRISAYFQWIKTVVYRNL